MRISLDEDKEQQRQIDQAMEAISSRLNLLDDRQRSWFVNLFQRWRNAKLSSGYFVASDKQLDWLLRLAEIANR
jgi:hypothetical protein